MQQKVKALAKVSVIAIWLIVSSLNAVAQFTIGGQLFQRAEFRNGYGKIIDAGQEPAFIIGQRARIHFQYDHEKVKFFVSAQDIRTWGSAPQVKATDNFLSIHESWGEIVLGKSWKAKLGRQELNYDNVRFLGNLDWALQARAHDFALIKYERGKIKLHVGAGYNQDGQILANQPFTTLNQYRSAQMLRFENRWGNIETSFLFWNNGLAQLAFDTLGNVTNQTIRHSQTIGLPSLKYNMGHFIFSGFYYLQVGRDIANKKIKAHDFSMQISHVLKLNEENGIKLHTTLGFEILSGTSQQATDNINRAYTPLYGTNHAHNGYMDFFYVGNRYLNTVGLQDYFLRVRYDPSNKFFVSLNTHQFMTAADSFANNEKLTKTLGTELDFTTGYIFNEVLSLQGGYSQIFATNTFESLQGVSNPSAVQSWAYVALLYRPNMKKRFSGLSF